MHTAKVVGRAAKRQRQAALRQPGQQDVELARVFGGEQPRERYYGANATTRE
jgi:hypothetical protein